VMIYEIALGGSVVDVLGRVTAEERGAADRPWLMLNMVTSVDGATTVEGGSTGLSDEDDRELFSALRTVADVVLVGAGTVRAENYRPVRLEPGSVEARLARGQSPAPRLVIVSGSLNLDPGTRVFSDPDHRPAILTSEGPDPDRIRSLSRVAEVVSLPDLEGRTVMGYLSGDKVVLCEGGPSLNGPLVAAGLVDEINWTISPMLVAGSSKRMIFGETLAPPYRMQLDRLWRGERSLFLRYLRHSTER
jgi:riboflavin biosynthesis pyrimidine reductase